MLNKLQTCRICESKKLDTVMDLGLLAPSGFSKEKIDNPEKFPLVLVKCRNCGLVQLNYTVDLDLMYRQYWYTSALNKSMISSLKDVVTSIESRILLHDNDLVIDIGCNDGTMLSLYDKNVELLKVGFDPALNLADRAKENCDLFINDYFDIDNFSLQQKAKVITAIAMFYDLPDPNKFLDSVVKCLDADGMFVIQLTDLYSMFVANAFDNICFEHLEYYSLEVLVNFLNSHGLEVFDVEYNDVNGGSVRLYAGFPGVFDINDKIYHYLKREKKYINDWEEFAVRIKKFRDTVVEYVAGNVFHGRNFYVIGASTKGNTLLQYFGIDDELIKYAYDVNPEKFGLYTIGSNIEVVKEFSKEPPYYYLVLPWHFIDNIIDKYRDHLIKTDARLLFPLPQPLIVTFQDGQETWIYL